jgi:hypothetical protein
MALRRVRDRFQFDDQDSSAFVRDYQFLQQLLAFNQRQTPHVIAVTIQNREKIVGDGELLLQFFGWILDAKAPLQPLKAAATLVVQYHDFSVEYGGPRADVLR